jgi:L-alanine-DL-glutamate epimerase-like enolase superfamily enzyme
MRALPGNGGLPVERLDASAYTVPTDAPESDGTLEWESTSMVLVEVHAGGKTGIGWSYTDIAAARLIRDHLARVVTGRDAFSVPAVWSSMARAVRNLGRPGLASSAISAVDVALWDLKGRLLEVPLVSLLGAVRESVPIYGSGGFTSYPVARLREQLSGWVEQGIPRVKMKVGREPATDVERVRAAREAIGPDPELFVDANGALGRKQALRFAHRFAEIGVSWFEEPVTSDDLEGLRLLRDRAPAGMEITAGEYGYALPYFRRMLEAGAVDVLMPDATRCGGITGLLKVGALSEAHSIPLSAHTAPSLHTHPCCAIESVRHLEYFHDHVRIEQMFFEGVPEPVGGALRPDLSRPGLGLEFRRTDARRYAV